MAQKTVANGVRTSGHPHIPLDRAQVAHYLAQAPPEVEDYIRARQRWVHEVSIRKITFRFRECLVSGCKPRILQIYDAYCGKCGGGNPKPSKVDANVQTEPAPQPRTKDASAQTFGLDIGLPGITAVDWPETQLEKDSFSESEDGGGKRRRLL